MKVNPNISFWLGVITTIMIGISSGAVKLTNVVPTDWIPYVLGWTSLFAFVNSAVLTALHGVSSSQSGPISSDK